MAIIRWSLPDEFTGPIYFCCRIVIYLISEPKGRSPDFPVFTSILVDFRTVTNLYAMGKCFILTISLWMLVFVQHLPAQVFINEGSEMNYSSVSDEDGEYPDWIEILNAGSGTVSLHNWTLSDDSLMPAKWVFPDVSLLPGEFRVIYCSGKDRSPVTGFTIVTIDSAFNAVTGWNTHHFPTPFIWDGSSDLLINTCSYSSTGYTTNSIFNQSSTAVNTTVYSFQDGSNAACDASSGTAVAQRPVMRINQFVVGTGGLQNSTTDYPAPYGNWYWGARHQMLISAADLTAAGLTAGPIDSLAFDVISTDPATIYDYIEISMKQVSLSQLSNVFIPQGANLHTNFKISSSGEKVFLYNNSGTLVSSLFINSQSPDNSNGCFPDGSVQHYIFDESTPGFTNAASDTFHVYLQSPAFSVPSGIYQGSVSVAITNPNTVASEIRYTTDGTNPTPLSSLYSTPVNISSNTVLKASAFATGFLPALATEASYLFGLTHTTPVLSVITDWSNLYGPSGIFDLWYLDLEREAYVDYFDESQTLQFSQRTGMQVDGGAGGSRSHPQHSFRIELDDPVLGQGSAQLQVYDHKPFRNSFGKFYLRNGSNMYLSFPYKDACETRLMCENTKNYYSAMIPVSVYINGEYFGLYEMREKMDEEFFNEADGADQDSVSILSQSYWGGGYLRAISGSVDSFYTDYASFLNINTADAQYWQLANQFFDLEYYTDYIVAESWIGNVDWPYNNIKLMKSDKTGGAWRFGVIDLELSLDPGGWTDCYYDHINFMLGQDPGIPYINVWLRSIQNSEYRNYFINRFADIMNTGYRPERLMQVEDAMYNEMLPEMPAEYDRWGDPANIPQQMSDFSDRHGIFQDQLLLRTAVVRNDIENDFSLNGQVNTILIASPSNAGRIKINTIVPDSLPWLGVYFSGNPVRVTAYPNPGYTFSHWVSSLPVLSCDTAISLVVDIPADIEFTAVFVPDTNAGKIVLSEINYHSDSTLNSGDWIELYNCGNSPVDVSGWKLSDVVSYHEFSFPAGSEVQPGERIVIAEDTLLFHSVHPGVQCLGPMDFGFSNAGEMLTLSDSNALTMAQVHYLDSCPWPQEADGLGHTLELLCDTCNPSLPASWFAGCIGGSPGTSYAPCSNEIIFSEINYKSADTADAGDWVELMNPAAYAVDISGWQFRDDNDLHVYYLPNGTVLQPGERLVLYGDAAKFSYLFPSVTEAIGPFTFGLSGSGEALRLFDVSGIIRQSVVYSAALPWPVGAAGNGYTLELVNPSGHLCDAGNWTNGCPGGSPSTPLTWPCWPGAVTETTADLQPHYFPNPSDGIFEVWLPQTWTNELVTLSLLNEENTVVFLKNVPAGNTSIRIDAGYLPAGIYFLRITSANNSFLGKLILEK